MRRTIVFSTILCCSLFLLHSCTKSSQKDDGPVAVGQVRPDQVVNARVSTGQAYTYSTSAKGNLSINRQAGHFSVSETGLDEKDGAAIYKYVPAEGYKGADEVLLWYTPDASPGNNDNGCGIDHQGNRSVSIIVKITVTD